MDGAVLRSSIVFLLILWATTGLTIVHLAVLGVRAAARPFRKRSLAPTAAPEGSAATLTFVVPVYNDGMTVGATIESILRQSVRPDRILVVDDGSTDETPQALAAFAKRGVDVLRLPANGGKTRALDAALREVKTDLVAITDADSVVHVDYVKEVLKSFRDPDLAAVGGAVESIPHTWVTAARQIDYMLTVRIDRDAESAMNALVVLPGVSSTYRADVLREMGFEFDTIAEDFDLTFRLQRANRKIAMNMAAKVYTSDPPTLRAYHRQLVRWYTDFWLVLKKHRAVLGKRVFGTVEVPLLVLNATVASALYLALPVWFAFKDPARLPSFFLTSFALDAALVVIAWRTYRRRDLWWALVSRTPTRAIGRFAYLLAMTRVLVGRPGLAWTKLERRSNDAFLAADRAPAPARSSVSMDGALWWAAVALVMGGGLVLPFLPRSWAFAAVAVGLSALLLRMVARALASATEGRRRLAVLVAAEAACLAAAAVALGLVPLDLPAAWRVAALAISGQLALGVLAWPPGGARRALVPLGHLGAALGCAALLLEAPVGMALLGYASGVGLLAVAIALPAEKTPRSRLPPVGVVACLAILAAGLFAAAQMNGLLLRGAAGIAVAAGSLSLALVAAPPALGR